MMFQDVLEGKGEARGRIDSETKNKFKFMDEKQNN
jgi:hypothetical protein